LDSGEQAVVDKLNAERAQNAVDKARRMKGRNMRKNAPSAVEKLQSLLYKRQGIHKSAFTQLVAKEAEVDKVGGNEAKNIAPLPVIEAHAKQRRSVRRW
jgi:hypothetical protein